MWTEIELLSYLGVFCSGTIIGIATTYLLNNKSYKQTDKTLNEKIKQNEYNEENFEFNLPDDEIRLVMAVRQDLSMQKGKIAAQCAHAAVAAYIKAQKSPKLLRNWLRYGGTKIAVKINSEEELFELEKRAKELKVYSSTIRDAGQTQVAPGSRTVIAIGPAPKRILQKISGHLKLL